ncbi:hypothetical protein VS877_22425, partial [Salmonella enterica subsp. enterica serovar Paratyphi A]|nr:hypothetical protein [Salmonella enterica subsp. enterica serovar Paratyphi A]
VAFNHHAESRFGTGIYVAVTRPRLAERWLLPSAVTAFTASFSSGSPLPVAFNHHAESRFGTGIYVAVTRPRLAERWLLPSA